MKPNQPIDFFSSPISKFASFPDMRQPQQDIPSNEYDLDQDARSRRKSSFHHIYEPITPLNPDFFNQKLEECEEISISQQNMPIDELEIPCEMQKELKYQNYISATCHKHLQQKISEQPYELTFKIQEKIDQDFTTPKKKTQFFGYKKCFQSTSEKQKSISRNNEKGLRRLSSLAYSIVSHSSATTYKEVAEKLLTHLNFDYNQIDEQESRAERSSMQNVKRRVYDSLNVLLALGVIKRMGNKIARERQKKPFVSNQYPDIQKYKDMVVDYQNRSINLQAKKKSQKQLKQKLQMFKRTVQRNKKTKTIQKSKIIRLPFLAFAYKQTQKETQKTPFCSSQVQHRFKQRIEWLSKKEENNDQKQKKKTVNKRSQNHSLLSKQSRKDEIVQVSFKSLPESYGDLDFFKLIEPQNLYDFKEGYLLRQQGQQKMWSQDKMNGKIGQQNQEFEYPLQQIKSPQCVIQENHMNMNLFDSIFQNA